MLHGASSRIHSLAIACILWKCGCRLRMQLHNWPTGALAMMSAATASMSRKASSSHLMRKRNLFRAAHVRTPRVLQQI